MTFIQSRNFFEEYAKSIDWQEILIPSHFSPEQVDTLKDGTPVINWIFDDGQFSLVLQTFGEDEPAMILDWNHQGSMRLSKLEAIKKLRCGDNWQYAKAMILESVSQSNNTLDRIGRKQWENYSQTSSAMSPDVRYVLDPLFQSIVDTEIGSLAAKELARDKFEEMKFMEEGPPTKAVSLVQFLKEDVSAVK